MPEHQFLQNTLTKGSKNQDFTKKILPLICYEAIFPSFVRKNVDHETELLVNISNDAWFGNSIAPFQHLQIARIRALETGRPILRATNDGLTALIDHKGGLVTMSPQFNPAVVSGKVLGRSGSTPYLEYRDYPALHVSVFIIFFLLYKHFRFRVDSNH